MAEQPAPAPRHFRAATRKWWDMVVSTYELESHHLKVLALACAAWERAEEARAVIKREGCFDKDRFGTRRAHPAVAVERDASTLFARLVRELDLDVDAAPDTARPPQLRRYHDA